MGLPLITRAEYKAYLGINSANQDAIIDVLIPKVSALVKTICRRTFVDYVDDPKQEIHSNGYPFLVTKDSPILEVVSLSYSSDAGKTYSTLENYVDYVLDTDTDTIALLNPNYTRKINGYKVVYKAGFVELPEELRLAVYDLISYYLKNDMAVHSSKAPGTNSVQIEYVVTTNLPAHIKRILDQFKADYA